MSDEAYSLVMALSCLCYIGVLYHQWQRGRAMKRLQRLLDEQEAAKKKDAGVTSDRTRRETAAPRGAARR